jgi:hypothetical protein
MKTYFTTDVAWAAYYMFRNDPKNNHLEEIDMAVGEIDEETGYPLNSMYKVRSKKVTDMQNNALPIHNMINGMGKIRLIHLYYKMAQFGPHRLFQNKTDSVSLEFENHEDKVKCDTAFKNYTKFYKYDKFDAFKEKKPYHHSDAT